MDNEKAGLSPELQEENYKNAKVVGSTDLPLEKMVDTRKQGTDTKNSEHKITYLNGIEFNEWALTLGGSEKRYFLEAFADKIARGEHKIPEHRTIEFDRPFSLERAVESVYQGPIVQDIKRDLQAQNSRKNESEFATVFSQPDGSNAYKEMYDLQTKMGLTKHSALGYDESLKTKLADHDVQNYEEGRINALVTFGKFDYYNPKTKSRTYVLEVRGLEGDPIATEVFQFSKPLDNYKARDFIHEVQKVHRTEKTFEEKILSKELDELKKEIDALGNDADLVRLLNEAAECLKCGDNAKCKKIIDDLKKKIAEKKEKKRKIR